MLEFLCVILGITCGYLSFNSCIYRQDSIIGNDYFTILNVSSIGIISLCNSLYRFDKITNFQIRAIIIYVLAMVSCTIYNEYKFNEYCIKD